MGVRYEIIRSIAKGGMAEVFRARAVGADGYGRVVALKRISPSFMSDEQAVEMLKDEARLALRLTHPNIVHVFEFERDEAGYFLVMEFVDGPDLTHLLRERSQRGQLIPPACSVAIAIDVLRALDYAHRLDDDRGRPLGVVHRDVSPSNILLSSEGVVKLGDFGIAKASGRLQTTEAGRIKGKMRYMAPEQVTAGQVDGRSDVFSLGLVLWECLVGRRAYDAIEDLDLFRQVMAGTVRSFEQVRAEVPRGLAEIVTRALQADPGRRFPSAGAMANALDRYHRRAHPDFEPEYLAALIHGTVPSTMITAIPVMEEHTESSRSIEDLEERHTEEIPPDMAKTKPPRPVR